MRTPKFLGVLTSVLKYKRRTMLKSLGCRVCSYRQPYNVFLAGLSARCLFNIIACNLFKFSQSINQSINQVYFQINMYKNEQKVHISQIDRKKVEVEVNNL